MQQQSERPPLVRPIVISGPSGAGKGTLLSKLLQEFPDKFAKAITHTTRKPRTNEIPGVHYYFTTREEMEKQIKNGEFIESAEVHGNLYGSSIKAVRDVARQGKTCLLEIDVQGCESLKARAKELNFEPCFIFILPPSLEELKRRLKGRATESDEDINIRLKTAEREMKYLDKVGFFDKVIVNDSLERAYNELKEFIQTREEQKQTTKTKLVDEKSECDNKL